MMTISFQYWMIRFCSILSPLIWMAPKIVMQSKLSLSRLRVGSTAFATWVFLVRGAYSTELGPTCGDCREHTCSLFHDHASNIWNTVSSLLHQFLQPVLIYIVSRFLPFICPFKRQQIGSSLEGHKKNPPPLKSFSVNHSVLMERAGCPLCLVGTHHVRLPYSPTACTSLKCIWSKSHRILFETAVKKRAEVLRWWRVTHLTGPGCMLLCG